MVKGISYKASVSTFAQCDGTNFSTAGLEGSSKLGNNSVGIYTGVGTEFKENSTGLIFDLKGSTPYGNSDFSGSFRLRNNINPNSQSLQIRAMPANFSVDVPIGKNTKFYATPYAQTKLHYDNGKLDNLKFGGYSGFSTQIGKNTRMFVEGQIYDFTDVSKKNTSINAGISVNI